MVDMADMSGAPATTAPLRVLVVDDDDFTAMVVCAMLQKFNAIPTCAADGKTAVNLWDEQAEDQRLDVVLLDWNLGSVMSGLEVLKHIQHRKMLSPSARVIMLSGNDPSDDDRNMFLQAGAAAYW
eukprot:CAMPEP_0119098088 /NCGR_PEP_ID=MMETSP1178-20130426/184406_1 /TAXON_ID=33656 /ORGANISM="unid sp, Strain CCMP2000" /LENGTH=124 /DNA_ID=CAMNT_0007082059 /DNA_START=67 /DNA_END=438 /DNA_ORIENTATION=+